MSKRVTVGFPRMKKEPKERRVFLPAFIQFLSRFADIYLEEGYGSRSGFSFDDYRQGNAHIFKSDRLDAFQKDFVIVLRSPNNDEYALIPGEAAWSPCCTSPPAPCGCRSSMSWG